MLDSVVVPMREKIQSVISEFLSPSNPVQSRERLLGRNDQLEQIQAALEIEGRGVFIHGSRGVGKTSLAQTAAWQYNRSDSEPLILACDGKTTFGKLVRELCSKATGQHPLQTRKTLARKASGKLGSQLMVLTAENMVQVEQGRIPEPDSINAAVALLSFTVELNKGRELVVVIDEFDRVNNQDEIALLGDLIKQIGDQRIPVKLIFCGVGHSLNNLLAGHESCFRYLEGIELERLGISPCMEIIQAACSAVPVTIDDCYLYRIAQISDGFPYFVHVLGTKLLKIIGNEAEFPEAVRGRHFEKAVQESIISVLPHLKSIYKNATEKFGPTGDDYEMVLWAVASHPDLERKSADIFGDLMKLENAINRRKDQSVPNMSHATFGNRINALKKEPHSEVLRAPRTGWYEFREPMVRGLCRLEAAKKYNISLGSEYYHSQERWDANWKY